MAYIGRDTDKISNVEVLDNITFDGSSSYTLQKGGVNFTPSSANTLLLSIDGVVQAGNFTVSGSTIDFGTAVAGTSTCDFILHYGVGLITAPSDGTVTTAKLADGAITSAKLASGVGGVAGITSSADATAITIDSSENVGIGISPTPPTAYGGLHIHSTYPVMKLSSTSSGSGTGDGFVARIDSTPRVELWNFENSDMVFATNNTERMRIRAGGGLAIGGTGDANTLDDYEEGTFTPTYVDQANTQATSYTNNSSGTYTKIGNRVFVNMDIEFTSIDNSNMSIYAGIGGYPFTCINSGGMTGQLALYQTEFGTEEFGTTIEPNKANGIFYHNGSTVSPGTIGTSLRAFFNFSYSAQ